MKYIFHRYGKQDCDDEETLEDAVRRALHDLEFNEAWPARIVDDRGNVIWFNPGRCGIEDSLKKTLAGERIGTVGMKERVVHRWQPTGKTPCGRHVDMVKTNKGLWFDEGVTCSACRRSKTRVCLVYK